MSARARALLAGLLLALAGCAGLPVGVEAPRVSLAGLRPEALGLLEQQYLLTLRVQNPNDFALDIAGLDYTLEVNDQPFAEGVAASGKTIPAFGTDTLEVTALGTLQGVLNQLGRLQIGGDGALKPLRYRLAGKLRLRDRTFAMPFEVESELELPAIKPSSR